MEVMKTANNKPYKNVPLIMALIDISFSELPNFEKKFDIEELAESLFKLGFTEKQKIILNGLEVKIDERTDSNYKQGVSHTNTNHITRSHWVLLNHEKTKALHILSDKIILKVTDYSTFDEFKELFKECLTECSKNIPLLKDAHAKRIGIRYLDLIAPKLNVDVNEYLGKEWHSPSSFISKSESRRLLVNKTTQFYEDDNVKVKLDSTQFYPSNGANIGIIPDDLADDERVALQIKFLPWIADSMDNKQSYVLLDIDAFREENLGRVGDNLVDIASGLRKKVNDSFKDYITDKAEMDWSNEYGK
jgi:uncharacterized protein (TIGR04255 family)